MIHDYAEITANAGKSQFGVIGVDRRRYLGVSPKFLFWSSAMNRIASSISGGLLTIFATWAATAQAQYPATSARLRELERQMGELIELHRDLLPFLETMQGKLDTLESRVAQWNPTKHRTDFEAEIRELQTRCSQLEKRYENLTRRPESARAAAGDLRFEWESLDARLRGLESRVEVVGRRVCTCGQAAPAASTMTPIRLTSATSPLGHSPDFASHWQNQAATSITIVVGGTVVQIHNLGNTGGAGVIQLAVPPYRPSTAPSDRWTRLP